MILINLSSTQNECTWRLPHILCVHLFCGNVAWWGSNKQAPTDWNVKCTNFCAVAVKRERACWDKHNVVRGLCFASYDSFCAVFTTFSLCAKFSVEWHISYIQWFQHIFKLTYRGFYFIGRVLCDLDGPSSGVLSFGTTGSFQVTILRRRRLDLNFLSWMHIVRP